MIIAGWRCVATNKSHCCSYSLDACCVNVARCTFPNASPLQSARMTELSASLALASQSNFPIPSRFANFNGPSYEKLRSLQSVSPLPIPHRASRLFYVYLNSFIQFFLISAASTVCSFFKCTFNLIVSEIELHISIFIAYLCNDLHSKCEHRWAIANEM